MHYQTLLGIDYYIGNSEEIAFYYQLLKLYDSSKNSNDFFEKSGDIITKFFIKRNLEEFELHPLYHIRLDLSIRIQEKDNIKRQTELSDFVKGKY